MRIGVLTNPAAGRGKAVRIGAQVRAWLRQRGATVVDVSGVNADEAEHNSQDAAAAGVKAVVVVGGDGTVNLGLNAVAGLKVPLGIVPAGSGNDAARALGVPRKPAAALRALWERLERDDTRSVDAAAAVMDGHHGPRWFLTAAGVGLDAAINIRANGLRLTGSVSYAVAVLMELPGFRPYGYRIIIDDTDELTMVATLVSIANTSTIGGGLQIAPMADPTDGLLDIVLADGMRPYQALRLFPKVYRGGHMASPLVNHRRARTIRLEPSGQGIPPPALCADGEVFGQLPATIAIHPGALTVLA